VKKINKLFLNKIKISFMIEKENNFEIPLGESVMTLK
jgi:hypothetical protein